MSSLHNKKKKEKTLEKDISARIALEFNIQPTAPFTVVIKISTPKLQFAILCDSLFCSDSLSNSACFACV